MKGELKKAWRYQGNNMALPVANLEAALPFYAQVMGFRVLSRSDSPHRSVVLGRDSIQIGLAEDGGDSSQDGCAFEVDNAESVLAEFKEHGLEKEISALDIEKHDDASWEVFHVVALDGLCYWFGERQRNEGT
jgi:lactoylglutathione lyase